MARRDYEGNAVQTTITATLAAGALSISIGSATGWPAGGASGEFFVTVNPDLSNEERILVASRSGTTLTIASAGKRGQDGTSDTTHASGSAIRHSYSGVDADEANRHVNDATLDEHTQYMKTDGTRHDLTARHSAGSVVPTGVPTVITPDAAAAEGAGTTLARASHVHGIVAAAASTITGANAEGASTSFARADHNHALGTDVVTATQLADLAIDSGGQFVATLRPVYYSATAPASPATHPLWFDTTLLAFKYWNGSVFKAVPLGDAIAPFTSVGASSLFSASSDTDMLINNIPVVAGHLYHIHIHTAVDITSGPGDWTIGLKLNGVATWVLGRQSTAGASDFDVIDHFVRWEPTVTQATDDIVVTVTENSGTSSIQFQPLAPERFLEVIDVGLAL